MQNGQQQECEPSSMKVNSSTGDTLSDSRSYSNSPTEQEDDSVYPDGVWPEQLDIESQEFADDGEEDKQKNGKKNISSYTFQSAKIPKYFHTIILN